MWGSINPHSRAQTRCHPDAHWPYRKPFHLSDSSPGSGSLSPPVWVQPGLCWALDTGAGGGGVACMDPAVYHPASSRISRIQCIVHPNPLFRHLKAACHHHFPSPRPPHSAPDRQTSVRDLAISAGGEGGSLLPLTKHLTCAKAAQLLSFNPPGPCEAAP